MIPQVAHFVWSGPIVENVTWHYYMSNIERFREFHPGWDVRFWRDEQIRRCPYFNRELSRHLWRPIWMADYARICILRAYGGLYLDLDIEVTANIARHLDPDRITIHQEATCPFVNNCLIATKPSSPGIIRVHRKIEMNLYTRTSIDHGVVPEPLMMDVLITSGPLVIHRDMVKHPGEYKILGPPIMRDAAYHEDLSDSEIIHRAKKVWLQRDFPDL